MQLIALNTAAQQPEQNGPVYEVYQLNKPPEPLNMNEVKRSIVYPDSARVAGIEGRVYMKLLVSKEGTYLKHVVKKSPSYLLTQACAEVLPQLKFSPGIYDGNPVTCWVAIPFNFALTGGETEAPLLSPQALNQAEVAADIKLPKKCSKQFAPCILEVMVLVDVTGKPVRYMSGASPDPCLYAAAEPHLGGLLFSPAQVGGKAVEGWAKLLFEF